MTLIFGYESKITKEEYDNEMAQKKLNWLFTPKLIRDRAQNFINPMALNAWEEENL